MNVFRLRHGLSMVPSTKGLWRHPCATVFYLPETEKRLTIIKFSISKASLTKNPIPNTGRTISGKDSDEVIQQFGASLT